MATFADVVDARAVVPRLGVDPHSQVVREQAGPGWALRRGGAG